MGYVPQGRLPEAAGTQAKLPLWFYPPQSPSVLEEPPYIRTGSNRCWGLGGGVRVYGGTYEQKSNNENAGMATNVTTKCQAGSDKCVYTVNHIFACLHRWLALSLPIMESLILRYFSQ